MSEHLHRHLDGEADRRGLTPDDRREAELWDRITASLRSEAPGPAPAWLESRVMAEVSARRPHRRSPASWWTRPRAIRISPLGMTGLAAAAVAALMAVRLAGPDPTGPETDVAPVVYVQFMLRAPEARSVAVSGDFNQWSADAAMEDSDGDGVWTVRIPVDPGVHQYMFVVDGERWVTDPAAGRYADDGFGNRNAVLAVPRPDRSS